MLTIAFVGLADKAVAESHESVWVVFSSVGIKRIVVKSAQAYVVKEGAHFDLLMAMGVLPQDNISDRVVLFKLALGASIQQVLGV